MFDNENKNEATIDMSRNVPDFFSCRNCAAWQNESIYQPDSRFAAIDNRGFAPRCLVMLEHGLCRVKLLEQALAIGAVQIVITTEVAVDKIPRLC